MAAETGVMDQLSYRRILHLNNVQLMTTELATGSVCM